MKTLPAVSIQFPICQLVLTGQKTVETRTYPLPKFYIGKELFLVETPGKLGRFKSRVVGVITFSESFMYASGTQFYEDSKKHHVTKESPWAWKNKPKWGWKIAQVKQLETFVPIRSRLGIVFTRSLSLN